MSEWPAQNGGISSDEIVPVHRVDEYRYLRERVLVSDHNGVLQSGNEKTTRFAALLVGQNVCHFTKRQDWIAEVSSAVTWKSLVLIIEQDTITVRSQYCLRPVNRTKRRWSLQQGAGSRGLSRKRDSTNYFPTTVPSRVVVERNEEDRNERCCFERVIRRREILPICREIANGEIQFRCFFERYYQRSFAGRMPAIPPKLGREPADRKAKGNPSRAEDGVV
jgi:hypothetical protein